MQMLGVGSGGIVGSGSVGVGSGMLGSGSVGCGRLGVGMGATEVGAGVACCDEPGDELALPAPLAEAEGVTWLGTGTLGGKTTPLGLASCWLGVGILS
jgi:hypothetical protein